MTQHRTPIGNKTLSDQLREAIRGSWLSLYKLSKRTGVDHAVLSRFLRGDRTLTLETVDKLADQLQLQLQYPKGGKAMELHLRLGAPDFAELHVNGEPSAGVLIQVASHGTAHDPDTIERAMIEELRKSAGRRPQQWRDQLRRLGVRRGLFRQLAQEAATNWEEVERKARRESRAMDAPGPRLIDRDDELHPLRLAGIEIPAD